MAANEIVQDEMIRQEDLIIDNMNAINAEVLRHFAQLRDKAEAPHPDIIFYQESTSQIRSQANMLMKQLEQKRDKIIKDLEAITTRNKQYL